MISSDATPANWIDAYVARRVPRLQEVANALRTFVKKTVPGSRETVNPWRIPTFESSGPMCYFSIGKNHVTFGFLRGTSLPDPHGLLEGTGKNLRHVKLRSVADVRRPALAQLVKAAARVNRKAPTQGMRPKRGS